MFHIKKQTFFTLRLGNIVYGNFNQLTKKDFERYVKPYLLSISRLKKIDMKYDGFKKDDVLILRNTSLANMNPNYVLVSNDIPLEFTTNYKTKPIVVADCSNSYKFVKKLKTQCARLDIPFYSVKERGAFKINL